MLLHQVQPNSGLKAILSAALGALVVVDKLREIYYADNVKFHIDKIEGLGSFVEIEAAGDAAADRDGLLAQCREYMKAFAVREEDLVAESYSDLLLKIRSQ
ncbi:MAG: CYTH domain-containing protein [Terriglobales bacterium]